MSNQEKLQDCIKTEMELLARLGELKKELDVVTKRVTKLWHQTDDALDVEINNNCVDRPA